MDQLLRKLRPPVPNAVPTVDCMNANDLLQLIAEQSSDFIAALDTEFRYRALNAAYIYEFERIFGTRLEVGMSVPDALAHLPAERERVMAMFEQALRGEEFTAVQPFGDHRRDRRIYEVRFRPITASDGQLWGSFHVVRDVTAQRRAEAESQLLKSTTLAIAGAATFEEALTVALNRVCEQTGWATGEAWLPDPAGERIRRAAVTDDRDERLLRFHEKSGRYTFGPGEGLPGRVWQQGRPEWLPDVSRSQHFVRAHLAMEAGLKAAVAAPAVADGEVVAVLCFFHYDVGTEDAALVELVSAVALQLGMHLERRRNEAVLRKMTAQYTSMYNDAQEARHEAESAVRARDEMLGVVAHDLRNPLSAISVIASLLETGEQPGGPERHLRTIHGLAEQMDRLIQDLLDVRRIEAGRLPLQPVSLMVGSALHTAAEMLQLVATEQEVRIEVVEPVPELVVRADNDRLLQVLSNLVGNAIKFSPAGGLVTLRVEGRRDEVVVAVSDQGPGIAEDQLPHVFDRFWQAPDSRRRGAGLGLTIAQGIIEAHGGRIWVESIVGEGSTFCFALPAVPAPPGERPSADTALQPGGEEDSSDFTPAASVTPAAPPDETRTPIRVLLVDDHTVLLHGLLQVLNRADDVEVVGAVSSGEEAIDAVESLQPDVLVMDLNMPGIGGLEATRRITAAADAPRVLALTSDTEEESLLPVLAAGGSGYVRKTHAATDLLEAIRAVARDETFLYPTATKLLLQGYRQVAEHDALPVLAHLDERERTMLALIAEGYTSREIGKKLFLSPKTVDTYRHQLLKKLGLSHRAEVVRLALRAGLLKEE